MIFMIFRIFQAPGRLNDPQSHSVHLTSMQYLGPGGEAVAVRRVHLSRPTAEGVPGGLSGAFQGTLLGPVEL